MSMFHDSKEGQTHSYNDGCGDKEHNREEGVYYPDDKFFPDDCCEKCHDVIFEKTYPAHTVHHACLNLKCECHTYSKRIPAHENIGETCGCKNPNVTGGVTCKYHREGLKKLLFGAGEKPVGTVNEEWLKEKDIIKAAKESSCLQRIQMKIWEYIGTAKDRRDAVVTAEEIFEDVKETLSK